MSGEQGYLFGRYVLFLIGALAGSGCLPPGQFELEPDGPASGSSPTSADTSAPGGSAVESTDATAPPALLRFEAQTGTAPGSIDLTVEFPSDTTDYAAVEIRRRTGAAAPSPDCTDGDLVAGLNSFDDILLTDLTGEPEATFSYRACIEDAAGNLTTTPAEDVPSGLAACVSHAGACWYLGPPGGSCDEACASHGGYNDLTRTWVGSEGTDSQCLDVMNALGQAQFVVVQDSGWGIGCIAMSNGDVRRYTNPTTPGASASDWRRACACNA